MRCSTTRDKLIVAGLYLSKFDIQGLKLLGFTGFQEAFNAIALSLKSKPASLKNYRDEFDPYYPNPRQGWHKRTLRRYCKDILDEYGDLDILDFAELLKTEIFTAGDILIVEEKAIPTENDSFAKRLVTGQAAEKYFETTYFSLPEFQNFSIENTTSLGCGFDFKMYKESIPFLAVEVKGMSSISGTIMLTNKEHKIAQFLANRYFLFVVHNFSDRPYHTVYRNPLESKLVFERRKATTVQISWSASISKVKL